MSFLLDTNVISELRKKPGVVDSRVLEWATALSSGDACISVITVMEIELGIARVEGRDAAQGAVLRNWLEKQVLVGFSGRVLPVDVPVARRAALLHVPDPRPERDAFIAATAAVHGLTVATRNVADFQPTGVAAVNPWEA
ncbi:type II toxin-antitoxin system VapC family toxin [Saccharopolyspora terrae]|uniref:Ribonuclease VapC n=1 Tax=Saccharopolyspora terrae TaxID=2530384 RepID=A0A4R4VLY1_9PSEU|nr:type II toxin-antitoxin system VapC family toxin [Saccharopolyspora terrae]TDD06642.1 type II toxin-antitoxin system VapC family toxin [Saccharopolyspora terrae]